MVQGRLQSLLGLSPAEAALLTGRAKTALGGRGYSIRVAAFLLATLPGLRRALPVGLRRTAIRPLVYALVPGPSENLLYVAGERPAE